MSIFAETLKEQLSKLNIPYDEEMIRKSERYFSLLLQTNEHLNLTRITDEKEAAVKHFADSLLPLAYISLPQGAGVLDIGTGAGFPAVPLKIFRPDIHMTALDATAKKVAALKRMADECGIDITCVAARAEDFKKRESFDWVVSRAVAQLNILTELCLPFVKVGGVFVAYKSDDQELPSALRAIQMLGGTVKRIVYADVGGNERSIIFIQKEKITSKAYPRTFAQISKKPL